MRTLKKTLAFVLVLAMVVSLGAMGASAAFTDTDDSDYGEAIEVMSGIGVINGMTADTFDPAGSLTREQAAKIIAYMLLGPTNAQLISNATSQKFSDVAADRWSAGYIEYCANIGIIAGVGDGKFDPTGVLTTCAFSKMVLCALGYKADVEGLTGESWAINAASLAVTAGIADSTIPMSSVTPCTREQACQIAYKALKAKTVQYTGGSTMTVGGVTITTGATRSYVTGPALAADNYDGAVDTYMQFCEAHFATLKYVADGTNAFGRPVYTWKLGAKKIGSYATKAPVASWTSNLTAGTNTTVEDALADYTVAAVVTVYVNGSTSGAPAVATVADIKALTANGKLVEVYANADNEINRVVILNTVLATITAKDVDKKTVTVAYGADDVTLSDKSSAVSFGDAYTALYAMDVDDTVLLVMRASGGDITNILSYAVPTTASGKYTASGSGKYTIGGTAYGVSANGPDLSGLTLGTSYSVTLDTYGYIIAQDNYVSTSTTYAFMVQGAKEGTALSGYTYSAQLIFADGSINWVEIASMDGVSTASALTSAAALTDKFVAYTENADGSYALENVSARQDALAAATITKNSPVLNSKTVSNSSLFLINTGTTTAPSYAVYTGIKNVPTTVAATGFALKNVAGTTYTFVLVTSVTATPDKDVVYIFDDALAGTAYVNSTLSTEKYNAIVNGVKTTIDAKDDQFTGDCRGLYLGNTYNSDGVILTKGSDTSTAVGGAEDKVFGSTDKNGTFKFTTAVGNTVKLADGVLTVDGTFDVTGVVADDFKCLYVDAAAKTCATKTLSSTAFAVSAIGSVIFVTDANGYVSYAIIVD